MARSASQSRIQIARRDIFREFDDHPSKVFKLKDIANILSRRRDFWRLTHDTTARKFIEFLSRHGKLRRVSFPFPQRPETRFVWGDVPLLEVLLTLKNGAYFTHYTAVRMHGLTEQLPSTIYLNHEQRPHAQLADLRQDRIDAAFSRAPRMSQNVIEHGDVRICLINGMYTGQLGVVTERLAYDNTTPVNVRLTDIERTLIDITVRPAYSGGVFEVLKAFRLAKERVSVNRMAAMLEKLRYVYPYHQAIGLYLERAGYRASQLDLLRRFPMEFDFYLSHQMGRTNYVKAWRLFVPEGF